MTYEVNGPPEPKAPVEGASIELGPAFPAGINEAAAAEPVAKPVSLHPAGVQPAKPQPAEAIPAVPHTEFVTARALWDPPPEMDAPEQDGDARRWAMFAHLGGCFVFLPLVNLLVPLVILQSQGQSAFVEDQAREALNFQITVMIALAVAAVLIQACVGIPLLIVVVLGSLVLSLMAAVQAVTGQWHRYPWSLRFLR